MQADRDRRQDRLTRRQRDCRTETEGRELVSWCFELSQPHMSTSGLRRESGGGVVSGGGVGGKK